MDDALLENALNLAQEYVARIPLILLGSGASVDFGIPGVTLLAQYLQQDKRFGGLGPPDDDNWGRVIGALTDDHLDIEAALDRVGSLSSALRTMITSSIWDCLAPADIAAFTKIIGSLDPLPLTHLYTFLLRSTVPYVVVVTTNYDRIAEYAAEVRAMSYFTGFSHGHLRKWTGRWRSESKHIRVYKVHGSLDWFENTNSAAVGLPLRSDIPVQHVPLIVPPSNNKYEQTYHDPFHTILYQAEDEIRKASAFLCIGYGFNDSHVQDVILNRCTDANIPIMVVSLDGSNAKKIFMDRGVRRWTIFEAEFEAEAPSHTRVRTDSDPTGWVIRDQALWKLPNLIPYIIGGGPQ